MSDNYTPTKRRYAFFNARLTSTISISLVLYLLGVISLIGILASELSVYVRENIGFSIILAESTSDKEVKALQKELEQAPYIKEFSFISKEDAMNDVVEQLGEDPTDFLGYNPLLASLEVRMKSDYANSDSIKWIERGIRNHTFVNDITYQKDLIQLVNENIKRIGVVLIAIALIFMFISFALVSNTIRLMAYSKRFLIHTMKLVGATPAFIRRPFILSNVANGIMAALLAILMLVGSLYYMGTQVENLFTLIPLEALLMVGGIVLVLGIVLTAVSAYMAVSRYIHMERDNLYYV